eukprot:3612758-Rhodomonas_salina.1
MMFKPVDTVHPSHGLDACPFQGTTAGDAEPVDPSLVDPTAGMQSLAAVTAPGARAPSSEPIPDAYPETDLPLGLDSRYGKVPPSKVAKQTRTGGLNE